MLKKMLTVLVVIAILLGISATCIITMPDFGRLPQAERLKLLNASPHFADGTFVSPESTQTHLKKGFLASMYSFLFESKRELEPRTPLPTQKTDLKTLDPAENLIVWMGHSSFYLQLGGKRILVDPIFSGHASPFSFMIRSFKGSDIYTADDLPPVDLLLISHDHWDHLDYGTVKALENKVGKVLTGLGVGEHFEYWGYPKGKIFEKDWYDTPLELGDLKIHITPARHFSGRFLKRNPTLPVSFVIESPKFKLFYSGDSAFGKHFAQIREKYGPMDFAVMEDGQYNEQWHFVHMYPEEMIKASLILETKHVMPVHNSKFILSEHSWDEPLQRADKAARQKGILLSTPVIGKSVKLQNPQPENEWWKKIH